MSGIIIQKFGGTSVKNTERIFNVANIIAETYKKGYHVLAVVSAQGDHTDELLAKANEINPKANLRSKDLLLSTGEATSAALVAMALEKLGLPAVPLMGWQCGVETDTHYGSAHIKKINTERVLSEFAKGNIVVMAGFQGVNIFNDITTLGRGASDTSAVAMAAALKAEICQIYTDVDGVFTTDPRIVPNAKKLDFITYDEMLELATLGANVLHNRSVEIAKKYHIDLEVLSSITRKQGTIVQEIVSADRAPVRGVAKDEDIARISIIGVPDRPGIAFKIFSKLSSRNINVDIILQSIGRNSTKDISFTVAKSNLDTTFDLLKDYIVTIGASDVVTDCNVAKVSIVSAGMKFQPGVASKMFESLYQNDINIQMISTSEIKVTVLVDKEKANLAVQTVHAAFFGE